MLVNVTTVPSAAISISGFGSPSRIAVDSQKISRAMSLSELPSPPPNTMKPPPVRASSVTDVPVASANTLRSAVVMNASLAPLTREAPLAEAVASASLPPAKQSQRATALAWMICCWLAVIVTDSSPVILASVCSVTELVLSDRAIDVASESQNPQSASESESARAFPFVCAVSSTVFADRIAFAWIVTPVVPLNVVGSDRPR